MMEASADCPTSAPQAPTTPPAGRGRPHAGTRRDLRRGPRSAAARRHLRSHRLPRCRLRIPARRHDPASPSGYAYVKYEPQRNGVDWIYNILQKPELINFTSTPHGNEKIADFMFKTKLLRNRPESWKDLYWEGAPAKDGN